MKLFFVATATAGGDARYVEEAGGDMRDSCDESEPRSDGGVGSEAEIEGSDACDCDCDCCMAGALLIEVIDAIDAIEAECERLDSDEGELPSASPEQGRMGGVGGRNTRLYSAELWRARSGQVRWSQM